MQGVSSLPLTDGINESRDSFAINVLVLVLLNGGGGVRYCNQNTIEMVQKAGVRHGVSGVVEAGMVDQIAEFSQPAGACGGANNFMTLVPQMDGCGRSNVSATNNPEAYGHAWSNIFQRI